MIKYSVFLTDRESVAAASELVKHYGANTTCLQARVVLKEIGFKLILGGKTPQTRRQVTLGQKPPNTLVKLKPGS